MIDFLARFLEHVQNYPDRIAVVDHDGEREICYKDLDEYSSRVATYLNTMGMKKEDVVAVHLDRGMEYIAVELGVIKTGCAYVPLSDSMGNERISQILKDCNPVFIFDNVHWENAMKCEPLPVPQWADPNEHDLAFIIYTSGSTGNPKGVMEEYGAYSFIIKGSVLLPYYIDNGAFRYANVAPVTFSAFTVIYICVFYCASTNYIVSDELFKNPPKYIQFLKENNIDMMFLTASLFKTFSTVSGLSLKMVEISSERVSDVYSDKFDICNIYGNTELMSVACNFIIDKPYPNTPIGRGCSFTDMFLYDDGRVSETEGEICLSMPFFRGYKNLRDETEKVHIMIDGKRFYRTGDIARRGDDGLLYILGRADDMVKIHGNRVEPAEIEETLKKVLGTSVVSVKPFERGNTQYLCAYYQKEKALPSSEIIARLKHLLPDYMIPSYFVQMDKIPLNTNGKIDKKNLPIPDFVSQNPYIPPRTESEKLLCKAFKNVLEDFVKIEKIGIDDDFFLMGGDSVSAMELMLACEELKLTVPLIYEKRTVRAIAETLDQSILSSSPVPAKETLVEKLPLIRSQKELLDYESSYPNALVDNLSLFVIMREDIDEEKFYLALKKVIEAHPALRTVFENDRMQGYVQYQKQNVDDAISIEAMSEKELEAVVEDFGKIFPLDGSPLFRCRIIRTESRLVLLLEIHHAVVDGLSMRIFTFDLEKAYRGEVLMKDCYNEFLKESYAAEKGTSLLSLTTNQNATVILPDGKICYCAPKYDFEKEGMAACQIITIPCAEKISAFCFAHSVSRNGFYLFATALTLALYNDCEQVAFDWIWNGRDSAKYANTIGYFLKELFIALELTQSALVLDALITCKNKILQSLSCANDKTLVAIQPSEERLCFIFQGDMYDPKDHSMFTSVEWLESPYRVAESIMDIEIMEHKGKTEASFDYDGGKFKPESIAAFSKIFAFCCQMILKVDENTGLTIGELKRQWEKR